MGKPLNLRQQRFVTEYMKTGIASRAYLAAGYKATTRLSLDPLASRLTRNSKVKREIARRKAAMLKRSDITIEKLLSDAEDARKLAMETKQAAAATGAGQFQAKLVGLLIDRKEQGAPGDFQGVKSRDEVMAVIRAEMGDDAAKALEAMLAAKPSPPVSEPAPEPVTPTAQGSDSLN